MSDTKIKRAAPKLFHHAETQRYGDPVGDHGRVVSDSSSTEAGRGEEAKQSHCDEEGKKGKISISTHT